MVAPGVAKVGSVFPRFQASIWESRHEMVARARFHKKNGKKHQGGGFATDMATGRPGLDGKGNLPARSMDMMGCAVRHTVGTTRTLGDHNGI